jgi:hypothetical protein
MHSDGLGVISCCSCLSFFFNSPGWPTITTLIITGTIFSASLRVVRGGVVRGEVIHYRTRRRRRKTPELGDFFGIRRQ